MQIAEGYQNKNDKVGLKHFMQQFKEKDLTSEEDKSISADEGNYKRSSSRKSHKKKPRQGRSKGSPD